MIDAVVLDVGETLVDETREYGTWADWLGVPRHTFCSVFGAVIATGRDYREVFQHFRPGFDLDAERAARAEAGFPEWFGEDDLYPDVRPCMSALRAAGVWVGVAGNQTVRAGALLRGLGLPADLIATSDDWGGEQAGCRVLRGGDRRGAVPGRLVGHDRRDHRYGDNSERRRFVAGTCRKGSSAPSRCQGVR